MQAFSDARAHSVAPAKSYPGLNERLLKISTSATIKDISSIESHTKVLHVVIEEQLVDNADEIYLLGQLCKLYHLGKTKISKLKVTYKALNCDDAHNPTRLIILADLLLLVDWDYCKNVALDLYINQLFDDPRLLLLEELPVALRIHGNQHRPDDYKLKNLGKSFSYLEAYI